MNAIFIIFGLAGIYGAEKLKFEDRPNVVLIIADDYGYNDIGYHQGKQIIIKSFK